MYIDQQKKTYIYMSSPFTVGYKHRIKLNNLELLEFKPTNTSWRLNVQITRVCYWYFLNVWFMFFYKVAWIKWVNGWKFDGRNDSTDPCSVNMIERARVLLLGLDVWNIRCKLQYVVTDIPSLKDWSSLRRPIGVGGHCVIFLCDVWIYLWISNH